MTPVVASAVVAVLYVMGLYRIMESFHMKRNEEDPFSTVWLSMPVLFTLVYFSFIYWGSRYMTEVHGRPAERRVFEACGPMMLPHSQPNPEYCQLDPPPWLEGDARLQSVPDDAQHVVLLSIRARGLEGGDAFLGESNGPRGGGLQPRDAHLDPL